MIRNFSPSRPTFGICQTPKTSWRELLQEHIISWDCHVVGLLFRSYSLFLDVLLQVEPSLWSQLKITLFEMGRCTKSASDDDMHLVERKIRRFVQLRRAICSPVEVQSWTVSISFSLWLLLVLGRSLSHKCLSPDMLLERTLLSIGGKHLPISFTVRALESRW